MSKGTAVIAKGELVIVDTGTGPMIRRVLSTRTTPTGVFLELDSVGRKTSERRWAKVKPLLRLFDKDDTE